MVTVRGRLAAGTCFRSEAVCLFLLTGFSTSSGKGKEFFMKAGIHPEYKITKITCQCGNVSETRSTVENINVEICSACHPFYTGKQKLVDTAGRIERFNRRYGVKSAE